MAMAMADKDDKGDECDDGVKIDVDCSEVEAHPK